MTVTIITTVMKVLTRTKLIIMITVVMLVIIVTIMTSGRS